MGGFFNGYCHHKRFLPLYVFCGNKLLVAYFGPGNVPYSKHSLAILKLLVKKLRKHWHDVQITFRADVDFYLHKMFNWCERNNINYIIGISANNCLMKYDQLYIKRINKLFNKTEELQRIFGEFQYTV